MKKTFIPIQIHIDYFEDVDIITKTIDINEGPLIPAGFFDAIFWN